MQQLEFTTSGAIAQALSDHLFELGALAVTLCDAQDNPIFEPAPETLPLWPSIKLTALWEEDVAPEQILLQLYAWIPADSIQHVRLLPVENRDWVRETQQQFQPMCFAERLWIYSSWHQPPVGEGIKILLDPGLAFGTGTHPTTALMLTWLAQHPPSEKIVMDYGCGSGILGIAAAALGATRVIGIDIDPQALLATRENASRNHIADDRLEVYLPAELPSHLSVDVLLANILAEPLLTLAPLFADYVKPQGWLALSGILANQKDAIIRAYQEQFNLSEVKQQDEWVCIVLQRKIK